MYAYSVAKRCGYSEDLSRALGYAVAQRYAIWKNVGKGYGIKYTKYFSGQSEHRKPTAEDNNHFSKDDLVRFAGCEFWVKENKVWQVGIARATEPVTRAKFDAELWKLESVKKNGFQFLVNKITDELRQFDVDFGEHIWDRDKASRAFFNYWKQRRDAWREPMFWH